MLSSTAKVPCWLFLCLFLLILEQSPPALGLQFNDSSTGVTPVYSQLLPRQQLPEGECTKDIPCANYACCNGSQCGFDPDDHCSKEKCTSKCDAKAECGRFAKTPGLECPINVCCSKHGFCGVEPDFCEDGCQSNCDQPGKTSPHTTDVRELVIGYVEGWAFSKASCAGRKIDSIKIDSVTHLFVAFGYIRKDFSVYPMAPGVWEQDLLALTNLKRRAPGLKVWIALGGWSFSDNNTDTQAVWGELASTQENRQQFLTHLEKFMIQFGFDGVDYDWEYPGATDRGGKERDGQNFVELVKDTRAYFKGLNRGWGISFTAPSSYWYLRHFEIGAMMEHVDFVNLMTYDLYGSWDEQSDWIGPHVYGHTNLTVIKRSLDLLWRNGVPANQVNLGLGFYGRTYKLQSPGCDRPGCEFDGPGDAGQCSGQAGYMSYQDIAQVRHETNAPVVTDRENAIKYFRYNNDQWVSYDDEETLKWKVEFANSQGLRGLFIWAVTQDTEKHELLDAVLQPDGLGKFKKRNGVHSEVDDWDTKSPDQCVFSDCNRSCDPGLIAAGDVRCDAETDARKFLCCPLGASPDPKTCKWRSNKWTFFCGTPGISLLENKCESGEQKIISNNWFIDDQGRDDVCSLYTRADYCCATERNAECNWSGKCLKPNSDETSSCPDGTKFLGQPEGIAQGVCDVTESSWEFLCCEEEVDPECRWVANKDKDCEANCDSDEVNYGRHQWGGGEQCYDSRYPPNEFHQFAGDSKTGRVLCCKKDSVRIKTKNLPIPLEYLFDEKIEDDEEQSFNIDVDMDHDRQDEETNHPNDNSFGWHIMSGPPQQLQTLRKREGSHWEMYGCDEEMHEGRQSARLVCTRDKDHNCGDIFEGGVADTVLEMPNNCGPGKYALAVSLEPMHDAQTDSLLSRRLKKRLPVGSTVFNLTFDYGFHRLQGRADNKVKLRIDYSNTKDYWNQVVAAKPGTKKRDLDAIAEVVKRDHGGNWKRYVEESYRQERRSVKSDDDREELHKRWYSAKLIEWMVRLGKVNHEFELLEQRVSKTFIYQILYEHRNCKLNDFTELELEADMHARITADIQTSGVLTLIGELNNMESFKHSYINFRNKGHILASLIFQARGELRIPYLEETLLGIAPIGASFKIPGIVTIGPEFKLVASVEGRVTVTADARVDLTIAEWDYAQRYPAENSEYIDPDEKKDAQTGYASSTEEGKGPITFDWRVTAEGVVEFHLTPMITFGVVFDSQWNVPSAAVDLALDTYVRIHGYASVAKTEQFEYCIGAEAGYEAFARITAPTLFGVNLNRRFSLLSVERPIYSSPACPDQGTTSRRSGAPLGLDGPSPAISSVPAPTGAEAELAEVMERSKPGLTPLEVFSLGSSSFV